MDKKVFWGHLYGFFGLVTTLSSKPSQGGVLSHRDEPGSLVGLRQRGALEGWKGLGAERERHICCTAGRSV